MTFNPLIKTPIPNKIQSIETFSGSLFSVTDTATITGTKLSTYTSLFGNSSFDTTTINKVISTNSNLDLRSSVVNFVGSSGASDLSFNDTTLFIDGTSQGLVGIGTNTPDADLHVVGSFKSTGNANILDGFFRTVVAGDATIAITEGFITFFSVNGNANFRPSTSISTNQDPGFFVNTSGGRIGMGTDEPLAKIHIKETAFSTDIINKIIDPNTNILIEKSSNAFMQLITSNTNTDNCNGILFSAHSNESEYLGTRQFAIYGNWGNGTSFPGGNSTINPPGTLTVNDLGFAYMPDRDPVDPFYTAINTSTFAWFSNSVSFADIYFTGQHRCKPSEADLEFYADKIGLIVVSEGVYSETLDPTDSENTTISINESLPKVRLSTERNDKKVFGVISDKEDQSDKRIYSSGMYYSRLEKRPDDHRLIINSVGEGAIWITNINGNFENGDYITSCEIPGYGMKQDTDLLMNYTVAKITCDCDFNLNSSTYVCEEFEFSGSIYRKAFVGCTYHCG
jgi:hypothetical protein